VLQSIVTNLAQKDEPNGRRVPNFPSYGDGRVFDLNSTMLGSVFHDLDDNERRKYWQSGSWHRGQARAQSLLFICHVQIVRGGYSMLLSYYSDKASSASANSSFYSL
jgi:hypothetical protein